MSITDAYNLQRVSSFVLCFELSFLFNVNVVCAFSQKWPQIAMHSFRPLFDVREKDKEFLLIATENTATKSSAQSQYSSTLALS